MKISELMIRDIRAEIEVGDEIVVIRNPKGDVKVHLLDFFKQQIELEDGKADDFEVFKMLMFELTNIDLDGEDDETVKMVLENPSHEFTRIVTYLAAISQELIYEVTALINSGIRVSENDILNKDTLRRISDLEFTAKEINHRKLVDEANKTDDSEVVDKSDGKEV